VGYFKLLPSVSAEFTVLRNRVWQENSIVHGTEINLYYSTELLHKGHPVIEVYLHIFFFGRFLRSIACDFEIFTSMPFSFSQSLFFPFSRNTISIFIRINTFKQKK